MRKDRVESEGEGESRSIALKSGHKRVRRFPREFNRPAPYLYNKTLTRGERSSWKQEALQMSPGRKVSTSLADLPRLRCSSSLLPQQSVLFVG